MIMKRFKKAEEPEEKTLTSDDQDTVRYLINKQTFDSLWDLNSKIIEQLIGKSLSHFSTLNRYSTSCFCYCHFSIRNSFASFSSMWYGIVQKGRKRLFDLLENDNNKLNKLLEDIRGQF